MFTESEMHFNSSHTGKKIFATEYIPDTAPLFILQIAHGIGEHGGRYAHFARFMAEQGAYVVVPDHLGHGRSINQDEQRGMFAERDGWNFVVSDVDKLRRIAEQKHPGTPYFLLGHSMGSFIARTYVTKHSDGMTGLLLSGTGFPNQAKLQMGIVLTNSIRTLRGPEHRSRLVRKLAFADSNRDFEPVKTPSDWLSRDESIVLGHINDEMCQFLPTVSMYGDMFEGIRFVCDQKNVEKVSKTLPILLFSGDKDPIGDRGEGVVATYNSYLEANCSDVQLKLYPEGRHEMLNELNRSEVYSDLLAWIKSKIENKGSLI